MKYIITYKAKRKNAKRHVIMAFGKTQYFNSVEDAAKHSIFENKHYNVEILTANYKPVNMEG